METTTIMRRRVAAAVAASTLLLAACGGTDDADAEGVAAQEQTDEAASSDADETVDTEADTESDAESDADSEQGATDDDSGTENTEDDAVDDSDPADDREVTSPSEDLPAGLDSSYLDSYTLDDPGFGTTVTVTVDGATRTIETNALPDHETGEFPNVGNPNEISAQDLTWELPVEAVYTGDASGVRTAGIAVNGIKFEPGTGESVTCESGENYRIEALQDVFDLGLDFNNAHVQPTGEYHYHGISALLVGAYESDNDLVHVGFAADGHLMYYSKSGAYTPGYALSDDARSGTGCVASGPAGNEIAIEGSTPDGAYTSDWVFNESDGNLDSCNGTTVEGRYVYIVTDTYPFVSRCLNGEVSGNQFGGGGGGGGQGGGGRQPGQAPGAGDDQEQAQGQGGTRPAAPGQGGIDLTDAAEALGVTAEELQAALGTPPPDLEAAAQQLGVTVEELQAVLPAP